MNFRMPPNPHTGLLNVTREEVRDAYMAQEDVELVRYDNTLTPAGMRYVADARTSATPHEIARRAGLSPAHFVAPARFRHGQPVTLTDANGEDHQGTLHLPPEPVYGPTGRILAPRVTDGGFGLHTIIRDGKRFRTEGRLS